MDEKDFFRQIDFSLEITPLKNRKLVEITPCIEVISEKSATLIVSFEVDGIELIESARIAIQPGKKPHPPTGKSPDRQSLFVACAYRGQTIPL